ncbi:DUF4138 domain-containing protein [Tamlana sp. 2_MG-2023]|uniref:DUF4138 domain-containing protein n=2 Tax=unclassified Tamlana TaxID=2614803 RepID=UPI0026E150A7|nr:DUF4138 domain-containing protein [Tamlana sp. 2_MG-2023]MDO6759158.1 DUF4138 domain-containing protein [Tamlana sp. 2_MG-2023]
MKNYSLVVCFMLMALASTAQDAHVLDTILVNDKMNVSLFFPDYIRQGITGSKDFVFTYNREKKQYFGLLQARPGQKSNLLAVTGDGQVYSYILKYSDTITKLNYFISKSESIGHEVAKLSQVALKGTDDSLNIKQYSYSDEFSRYLLKKDYRVEKSKRNKGVVLKLLETRHHKDLVYLVLELKNKSKVDFELEYLKFYKVLSTNKRKASYQKLKLNLINTYNYPSNVKKEDSESFVVVLPKFSLGDNQCLQLELAEKRGSRIIILK